MAIDGGEGNYRLIDLIGGTITKISKDYEGFITLKRGHAYRFELDAPDPTPWKSIREIEAIIGSDSGSTNYEANGAIGYDNDTIYIAPNISVPEYADDPENPEDPLVLIITVYFI